MHRFTFALALGLAGLALGCGSNSNEHSGTPEQQAQVVENNLAEIAEDKTLTDQQAIEKYIKNFPPSWRFTSPLAAGPALSVKPVAGGFQLVSRDFKESPLEKSTPDEKLRQERDLIKSKLDAAARMLRHLKGRNVSSVSVTLFTKITGQDGEVPIFQAALTPAHLVKLNDATVAADAGSYYDPRGTKINEVWTVELNRFPDIEYTSRGGK
jgi:hypothetical protein